MSEEQENSQENHPIEPENNEIPPSEPIKSTPIVPPPFQQPPPFGQFGGGMGQQDLPNGTISLVLGILSIPACCCYGVLGLIFGIIAWALGAADVKKYALNPTGYTLSSYKNAKAGKVCGIIGTILSALYFVAIIAVIAIYGFAVIKDPDFMREMMQNR